PSEREVDGDGADFDQDVILELQPDGLRWRRARRSDIAIQVADDTGLRGLGGDRAGQPPCDQRHGDDNSADTRHSWVLLHLRTVRGGPTTSKTAASMGTNGEL